MGFDKPNYTQVPNLLLDVLMLDMTESELRVVLAAVRRTFGFHAPDNKAEISFSLFQSLTGLSRQSVAKGIEAAKARGVLVDVGRGKRGTVIYQLVINVDQSTKLTSQESRPELVKEVDHQLVKQVDTVKKEVKKSSKEKQQKNTRVRAVVQSDEVKPVEPVVVEETPIDAPHACENPTAQVFAFYEQNIGELKKYITDELTASIEEYTAAWVLDALKIAVGNQKMGLNYIDSILANWREHGRDYKPAAPAAVPAKSNSNGKSSEKVVYVPIEPQPLLPVLSPEQVEANRARLHAGKQAMLEALKEQTV